MPAAATPMRVKERKLVAVVLVLGVDEGVGEAWVKGERWMRRRTRVPLRFGA